MRDPERIDRILDKVRKIWKQHPELRLMQLLGNCFEGADHYYKEDEVLEPLLDSTYSKKQERNTGR